MLIFVPGLVQAMPQPVLAAVVISASISLFDAVGLRWLYRVRRSEFLLALACILGVIFLGVLQGIVVAVLLSVGWIFQRAWSPHSAVLGKPPGVPGWHDVERYEDARQVPGMLILRWSAPLFFANATQFRDRIRDLVQTTDPPPRWVVVAAEPIADIDTTAGAMLIELHDELDRAGIHFAFAELQTAVREAILGYQEAGARTWHFFASVTEAVETFRGDSGDVSAPGRGPKPPAGPAERT
jgi:MFS superfamily sulfate permease-like transporter